MRKLAGVPNRGRAWVERRCHGAGRSAAIGRGGGGRPMALGSGVGAWELRWEAGIPFPGLVRVEGGRKGEPCGELGGAAAMAGGEARSGIEERKLGF